MSDKEKQWEAKILMKDNATRLMLISSDEVREMIIEAKKNNDSKDKRLMKSIMPIEMWVMKTVLKKYSDGKLGTIICIEVREKRKGENHGITGLA